MRWIPRYNAAAHHLLETHLAERKSLPATFLSWACDPQLYTDMTPILWLTGKRDTVELRNDKRSFLANKQVDNLVEGGLALDFYRARRAPSQEL